MAAAFLASFLRALAVALLATAAARPVQRALRGRCGGLLVFLLALQWLLPALVPGYFWGTIALTAAPPWRELLVVCLLCIRLLPVAVAAFHLLPPPPVSPTARHCARLLGSGAALRRRPWSRTILQLRAFQRPALVSGVVFLLAFQDFELASLSGAPAWSVWLFDAQAGGVPLSDTLRHAALPVLSEAALLAILLKIALGRRAGTASEPRAGRAERSPGVLLVALCLVVTGLPVVALFGEASFGPAAWEGLVGELGTTLVFGAAATSLALAIVATAGRWLWVWCVPGLAGGLVLGLSLQALFQLDPAHALYDTPVPLVLGWALWLLPPTAVLSALLRSDERPVHLAVLLRRSSEPRQSRWGRGLLWRLRGRPLLVLVLVLFALVQGEVVLSSLLHPAGLTPAAVRLYNLMHYGRTVVLSGMVVLLIASVLLPVTVAAVLQERRGRRGSWS